MFPCGEHPPGLAPLASPDLGRGFGRPGATDVRASLLVALLVLLLVPPPLAAASDDAREDRWTREILPTLVVGDAVYLATPQRARVLALLTPAAGSAKGNVILVHGVGVHPDFGMIGALRGQLADAGYTTLSVQMPVLAADAPREAYVATFGDAAARLDAAVRFLRQRDPGIIAVVAHSMGASMVDAWRARADAARIDAWIPVGMQGGFSSPPRQPILDVLAEHDLPPVLSSAETRKTALPRDRCSVQRTIPAADHYFESHEKPLAAAIEAFLARVVARNC